MKLNRLLCVSDEVCLTERIKVVEAAGVEPASEDPLLSLLHA